MSNSKISVVLVMDAKECEVVAKAFGPKSDVRIEFAGCDFNEAFSTAVALKDPVIILRVENLANVKAFADKLNEKGIKYIALCHDAKDGFAMLAQGAVDMIARDAGYFFDYQSQIESLLTAKIKSAHEKYYQDGARVLKGSYGKVDRIIAIGSSTGGTEAVLGILRELPADMPPILIVQHMPPVFTRLFAERLHSVCKLSVWEAKNADELKRGLVLLAPGEFHMTLEKKDGAYRVCCKRGELVSGHCPSVDVLFRSVAKAVGSQATGIILTGMGKDGAEGLLEMRKAGAMTYGQDEKSCVVYGMPREAYNVGAVKQQLPLSEIAATIVKQHKG
jgi:two-component system chemotaxis response regulator CheB